MDGLDKCKAMYLIYLEISRMFDTVPHGKLLARLKRMGAHITMDKQLAQRDNAADYVETGFMWLESGYHWCAPGIILMAYPI